MSAVRTKLRETQRQNIELESMRRSAEDTIEIERASHAEEVDALKAAMSTLQRRIEMMQNDSRNTTIMIDALQQELESERNLRAMAEEEVHDAVARAEAASHLVETLQNATSTGGASSSSTGALTQSNTDAGARKTLMDEISRLREDSSRLQKEMEQLRAISKRHEKAADSQRDDNIRLQKELEAKAGGIAKLVQELAARDGEILKMKDKLKRSHHERRAGGGSKSGSVSSNRKHESSKADLGMNSPSSVTSTSSAAATTAFLAGSSNHSDVSSQTTALLRERIATLSREKVELEELLQHVQMELGNVHAKHDAELQTWRKQVREEKGVEGISSFGKGFLGLFSPAL